MTDTSRQQAENATAPEAAPTDRRDEASASAPADQRGERVTSGPLAERSAALGVVERARGGFSLGSVITGVLVAFGAFIILSAIIGAILTALGVAEGGLSATEARNATIGAGIGLVLAQFLAYLWGGYATGRMARGSGLLNGLLVPVVALVIVALIGAVVAAVAGTVDVDAATAQGQLPLPLSDLADIGTAVGVGVLAAMLLGGVLGGWLGQRWHTKLENAEYETAR